MDMLFCLLINSGILDGNTMDIYSSNVLFLNNFS